MAKRKTPDVDDLLASSADEGVRKALARAKALEQEVKALRADNQQRRDQFQAMLSIQNQAPARVTGSKRVRKSGDKREATAVLLCSDWHPEDKVEPDKVNGLNEFNLDIADHRIAQLAPAYDWLIRDHQFYDVRTGIIWLGGDLINGYIHEEMQESNLLSPLEAVLWVQTRIERMLMDIQQLTGLEKIIVLCSFGNHGRTTRKPRIATAAENNYEWMMYHQLARRFQDIPGFEFHVAKGKHLRLDIYDKVARFQHGDAVRYAGGTSNVGGVMIPILKAVNAWNTPKASAVDFDHMGHWHQYIQHRHVLVNGSLIGYSPFSLEIKAEFELPSQAFYLWDRDYGPRHHTSIQFAA